MITDSEAPTYNFDSDDEAPCEYLNDVYAISEDTFSFKIIKQLGNGYYNPGNGHKIKIIYYELGYEDKVTCVQAYLGKNDKLPYICEIAVKCMKENEVCIIQAPKAFMKIFKNSEKKNKYDKNDNFKVAFKKSLRFKQKCLERYLNFPDLKYFKRIKLSSNDIKILLRKKENIMNKKESTQNEKKTNNNNEINESESFSYYNEFTNEKIQNRNKSENMKFLKLEEINELRYKFLEEEDLCTFVVYLKEFCRVDILNDGETIIKEVIKEGKGILTPKKNDFIDFFIDEQTEKEYIHTIFDIDNLKYRGLFKILQNMKKKEKSKIILKGLECFHINYSTINNKKNNDKTTDNTLNNDIGDKQNIVSHESCNNKSTVKNNISEKINEENGNISSNNNEVINKRKEMTIELIDFKKSQTVNINSITNINNTNKLLFYISENDHINNLNKPIIDNECELIINLGIENAEKMKNKEIYLPINFYNNNNIKKKNAYFIFSYGSCFTAPLWFYDCFKNLKEGNEIIIPLSKNKNIFSESQFVYHLLFEDIGIKETHKNVKHCELKKLKDKEKELEKIQKEKKEYKNEKEKKTKRKIKKRKNSIEDIERKNEKLNDEDNFIRSLISDRNEGKGFFLINNLKNDQVETFCKSFFSMQNYFIEKNVVKEKIKNFPSYNPFKQIRRKIFYKRTIISIQKKKNIIINLNKFKKYHNGNYLNKKHITNNKKKKRMREKKIYNVSFFKNSLKKVYFDRSFYEKDAILIIQILKIICKKKDPWNMNISEQIENLKIYNERGNSFMKKKLFYAALIHYKKGFDLCRFSNLYKLIFEEKKLNIINLEDEQNKELILNMEKIFTNLSICCYKMNNYNDCIKYSEKASAINSHNIKSIYWKNMAYLEQNKYSEVIKNLNNSYCLSNATLLRLYNNARLIKKKYDVNFKSLFYAMYDKK